MIKYSPGDIMLVYRVCAKRELDKLGRPTGAKAVITNDMIVTGSATSSSITPPGFAGGGKGGAGHARGHLLGK